MVVARVFMAPVSMLENSLKKFFFSCQQMKRYEIVWCGILFQNASGRSIINEINKTGPSKRPWGSPKETGALIWMPYRQVPLSVYLRRYHYNQ